MLNYKLYFLFFLLLSADITFAQCSMCRAVLNSSEAQETAKGVNNVFTLFIIGFCWMESLQHI